MNRDDLKQMLRAAYEQGAHDVHENWQEDRDPDFTEAAYDYVASLDIAALRTPGGDEVERVARAMVAAQFNDWDQLDGGDHGYWCSMAQAAIAALSASRPVGEGWRPIETAPRDGTIFLAYGDHLPTYFYALVWEDDEWRYCSQGKGWASPPSLPTYWQPLPEPPRSHTEDSSE